MDPETFVQRFGHLSEQEKKFSLPPIMKSL
jgi:hypothetical protein